METKIYTEIKANMHTYIYRDKHTDRRTDAIDRYTPSSRLMLE